MSSTHKSEPAYIHIILILIIVGLTYLLIQVAILEPQRILEQERYWKEESRLRMTNIKQLEILYKEKFGKYTDNFDSLFNLFRKNPELQAKADSLFKPLKHGQFVLDSLRWSPKSHTQYILKIDTTVTADSVFTKSGRFLRIDTSVVIGQTYYLECPDGYGFIGDINNPAKVNQTSWGEK
ncbi:MAG: hypothetical protein N3F03_03625 [Ignavibacteria bacterium]|nr:hypothetical protein [Ignavibacteria bacterium]